MPEEQDMKVTQEILNAEIERIYNRDGRVRASVVLDESRPKDAPLHPAFEWRNSVAAEAYRLEQARRLTRRARIQHGERLHHVPKHATKIENAVPDGDLAAQSREGYYDLGPVIAKSVDVFARAYEEAMQSLSSATARVRELEIAARSGKRPDKELGRIQAALKALETAGEALRH